MLYLDKVKLKNFKSFRYADIPLHRGFVCLAGPNGSGKSNVIDGLRFAFGELSLKSLRAKRIPDLITIGSEKAEITVFLSGDKKYEIKRAIRRDGKTLYKLNGKRTTRTALMDILRPYGLEESGHNVIAQGQVQRFTDMNAKERRGIIDQIAGISEFEDKKKEALGELGKVEQKVNDATIVMREREGFLTELEKEKDDALKHMDATNRLRLSKCSLINLELGKVDADHTKVSEKYLTLKAKEDEIKRSSEELDKKIASLEQRKSEIVTKINEEGERKKSGLAKEVQDLHTAISVSQATSAEKAKETEHLKAKVKSLDSERKELESKLSKFQEDAKGLKSQISEFESTILAFAKEKDIALKDAESLGKHFGDIRKKVSDLSKKIDDKRASCISAEVEAEKLKAKKGLLEAELERMQAPSASPDDARRSDLHSQLKALNDELASLDSQLEKLFSDEKSLNKKLPELEKKFLEARDKYTTAAVKISAMRETPEQQAVTAVIELKERGMLPGLHGTVGELCKFKDDVAVAIEASAGNRLNYVIVESADVASKAIEYLKQRKLGRCTFIPLDKKPFTLSEDARALAKKEGSDGFIIDFVQFNPMYSPAYQYVFGDTLLVDSINAAKKIGIGRIRMVTAEGDLLESSGVITGGTFARKSGGLREKAEADKLRAELDSMKEERDALTNSLYSLRESMNKLRKERGEAEVKAKSCEIELRHLDEGDAKEREAIEARRKAIEGLKLQSSTAEKEMQEKKTLIDKFSGELANLNAQLSTLQKELEGEEGTEHRKKMDATEKQLSDLNSKKHALEAKLAGQNAETDVHKQRLASNSEEISSLKSDLSSVEKEIKTLTETIASSSKHLEEKMAKMNKVGDELSKLYNERTELEKQVGELAKERGKGAHGFERFVKQLAELDVQRATLAQRLADLKAEASSYSDIKPLEGTREEFDAKIHECDGIIQALGNVNLKAPELYEEKKRDIAEIKERVTKLADEKMAISRMIDEIDTRKKDVFMEAFQKLNENFKRLYSHIMPGEATFILDDPADIFNSGLSIRVKDSASREKYLESMSGGEKSLLALLFVFAIQMYRPAPFYVLDEADAALDKENSKKLSELLHQLAKATQFIVVTHNDTILSSADIALGVTKTSDGSHIVGIELKGKNGSKEEAVVAEVTG